ncbi:MAG TPA: hybrid sensor histidine kinase/response regulator [Vicinamibacterales bacterium]|jgi:signal transduction histidine kinase/ActR/RegA family two-component response regulator
MAAPGVELFDLGVWQPALEPFGAVTHLTIQVYDADGRVVCGPIHPTPLVQVFARHAYDPGLFDDCARRCLAQETARPTVVVSAVWNLAVVGTSLVLGGRMVGAIVAGYAFLDFCQLSAVESLAKAARIASPELWSLARQQAPVPERRLLLDGELLRVLGDTILRENAQTRRYERAAATLEEAAAARDEFVAVLSHELRSPLTPILGWSRMLRQGESARVGRIAEIIERNALLQLRLVDDLLELNRVAWGTPVLELTVHDLRDAARTAVDALNEQTGDKGLAMTLVDGGEPILVDVDVNRLQQVLRNVLSNAIKFTPARGLIAVTVAREADTATVRVRDTGQGIDPAFLPFVFDIFRQQERGTRRTHEGMGIGLALVKRLTELQGGRVAVTSAGAGQGSEVEITFPLTDRAAAVEPFASLASASRDLRGVRVQVVEDMDDARDATKMMLERFGADVVTARDGVEALETIEAAHPDVVLCDLRMPRMDGFEFLRMLTARLGGDHPPVVAISAFASASDHVGTEAAGFDGHIDKPFDETRLLAAVNMAVARRRTA